VLKAEMKHKYLVDINVKVAIIGISRRQTSKVAC